MSCGCYCARECRQRAQKRSCAKARFIQVVTLESFATAEADFEMVSVSVPADLTVARRGRQHQEQQSEPANAAVLDPSRCTPAALSSLKIPEILAPPSPLTVQPARANALAATHYSLRPMATWLGVSLFERLTRRVADHHTTSSRGSLPTLLCLDALILCYHHAQPPAIPIDLSNSAGWSCRPFVYLHASTSTRFRHTWWPR